MPARAIAESSAAFGGRSSARPKLKTTNGHVKIQKNNLRAHRYDDVAYIEGYINGIFYLVQDDKGRNAIPRYFMFGMPDLRTR
jgi:hypothetical protein